MSRKSGQRAPKILSLMTRGARKIVVNPGESILILRMAAWVAILSILVKLCPLPRALSMITPKTQGNRRASREEIEMGLTRAVDLLLGSNLFIFRPVCWKRAAILHRYLALNGIVTRIVFGVRKSGDGGICGHAWLETGGKPVLEKSVPDYVVTYTFPSNDPFDLELGVLTGAIN